MPIYKGAIIKVIIVSGAIITILAVLALTYHPFRSNIRIAVETLNAKIYRTPKESFPNMEKTGLSAQQFKIVSLSEAEYNKKPVSFDANVLKYSQGEKGPWCADFVSWIMNETNMPFKNPNSGSWRIPGVNTLQEYFQANRNYIKAGDYTPKVGDVAIYLNGRSHTNIVIAVTGSQMITVGGNETGHIRINTQDYSYGTQGLSGFGSLGE